MGDKNTHWINQGARWERRPMGEPNPALPFPINQILAARGFSPEAARLFLEGDSRSSLSHLNAIPGIPEAKRVIESAIQKRVPIVVYGDYDVDGLTAAALTATTLRSLGADVRPYIPNRSLDGYGLNIPIIHYFAKAGIRLIVTVDCGIRSVAEVEQANALGVQVVVTDHHLPGETLPPAAAIVNPKLTPEDPCYYLAGAGVAYAVCRALQPDLDHAAGIQLAALGTIADMAPLVGINRSLVSYGIDLLRKAPIPQLAALIESTYASQESLTSRDVAFMLAPRLNAAGRVDDAWDGYNLLVQTSQADAQGYVKLLEKRNRERQEMSKTETLLAEKYLDDAADLMVLFIVDENFSPGIVGLVAGNLCRRTGRPVLVGFIEGETVHVSARSPESFNIVDALEQCHALQPGLLLSYGGHAKAAGLTVKWGDWKLLHATLENLAEIVYGDKPPQPVIQVDTVVNFSQVDHDLLAMLDCLEPFGEGNPEPVFLSIGVTVDDFKVVGKKQEHLQLTLSQDGIVLGAIAFHMAYLSFTLKPGDTVDLVHVPQINSYDSQLQLRVMDIKPSGRMDYPQRRKSK